MARHCVLQPTVRRPVWSCALAGEVPGTWQRHRCGAGRDHAVPAREDEVHPARRLGRKVAGAWHRSARNGRGGERGACQIRAWLVRALRVIRGGVKQPHRHRHITLTARDELGQIGLDGSLAGAAPHVEAACVTPVARSVTLGGPESRGNAGATARCVTFGAGGVTRNTPGTCRVSPVSQTRGGSCRVHGGFRFGGVAESGRMV